MLEEIRGEMGRMKREIEELRGAVKELLQRDRGER